MKHLYTDTCFIFIILSQRINIYKHLMLSQYTNRSCHSTRNKTANIVFGLPSKFTSISVSNPKKQQQDFERTYNMLPYMSFLIKQLQNSENKKRRNRHSVCSPAFCDISYIIVYRFLFAERISFQPTSHKVRNLSFLFR